jgi:hypothetical protein
LLPFLKPKDKSVAGLIIKQRTPDEKPESEQDDSSASIDACAEELIRAVHARDTKAVANAMKDAFTILESEPHKEGEHVEKHTYAAQNEKAAQEP